MTESRNATEEQINSLMAKSHPILLAEDDENDVFFLKRALRQAGLQNPLFVARDGQEAVNYLSGEPPYADRSDYPMPALLLLDLKMPKMSGFDVLNWLQAQKNFKDLAVVVFSSSSEESDVRKALTLGADDFLVKPYDFQKLVNVVRDIYARWLDQT